MHVSFICLLVLVAGAGRVVAAVLSLSQGILAAFFPSFSFFFFPGVTLALMLNPTLI